MPRLSAFVRSTPPPATPQPGNVLIHSQQPTQPTSALDEAAQKQCARLAQLHQRRLNEHGPRLFRQDDGTLAPSKQPANPYTVASRRKWRLLLEHCCKTGGDADVDRTGVSARYHINTTYSHHTAAMAAAGMTPEFDESGSWPGFIEGKEEPLTDDAHPFRSSEPWASFAEQVFAGAPFQWYTES